jgi:ribosomal protein L35
MNSFIFRSTQRLVPRAAAPAMWKMQAISGLPLTSQLYRNQIMPCMQMQTVRFASHYVTKSASKRFIKTASGHLKCGHPGKKHINRKMTRQRLRRLSGTRLLTGKMKDNMLDLIGHKMKR